MIAERRGTTNKDNRQMLDQLEILAITIISAVILYYEWRWGGMNGRSK